MLDRIILTVDPCLQEICASTGGTKLAGSASLNQIIDDLSECQLLDPTQSGSAQFSQFGGLCHEPTQTGCLALAWWLPRDIPGVNDNIVQTDRYEFTVGFSAVQCRHNVNGDGEPLATDPSEADSQAGD